MIRVSDFRGHVVFSFTLAVVLFVTLGMWLGGSSEATHVVGMGVPDVDFERDLINITKTFSGQQCGGDTCNFAATATVEDGDYYLVITGPDNTVGTSHWTSRLIFGDAVVFQVNGRAGVCTPLGTPGTLTTIGNTNLTGKQNLAPNDPNSAVYSIKIHINFTSSMTWEYTTNDCGGGGSPTRIIDDLNRVALPAYIGNPSVGPSTLTLLAQSDVPNNFQSTPFGFKLVPAAYVEARSTLSGIFGDARLGDDTQRSDAWFFTPAWTGNATQADNHTVEQTFNVSLAAKDVAGHVVLCLGRRHFAVEESGANNTNPPQDEFGDRTPWRIINVKSSQFGNAILAGHVREINGTINSVSCHSLGYAVDAAGDMLTSIRTINASIFYQCVHVSFCNVVGASDFSFFRFSNLRSLLQHQQAQFTGFPLIGNTSINGRGHIAWSAFVLQRFTGTVRSSFDNSVIVGASVTAPTISYAASSNSSGNFVLSSFIGNATFTLAKSGFDTRSFQVSIPEGSSSAIFYLNSTVAGQNADFGCAGQASGTCFGGNAANTTSGTALAGVGVGPINLNNTLGSLGGGILGVPDSPITRTFAGFFVSMVTAIMSAIMFRSAGTPLKWAGWIGFATFIAFTSALSITGIMSSWIWMLWVVLASAVSATMLLRFLGAPSGGRET